MIFPVYVLYVCLVGMIRIYKWIELQAITLLFPFFRWRVTWMMDSIGVVLHKPGEYEKWTEKDEQRQLAKCKKYDSIVHINIKDDTFYTRCANMGTLAAGECYMDGTWNYVNNAEELTELGKRWMEQDLHNLYWHPWNRFLEWLELCAFNLQTRKRAFQVIDEHYNLGDDLFERMLDPWMQYTCGYWAKAKNLNEAQEDKMHLIARKLKLEPGMRVLDIGCGWGNLANFLASKYQVRVVGITISEGGVRYGNNLCKGLPVEIRLQDYRDLNEKFDRIVSVGMFEHVGYWNYDDYFKAVHRCLEPNGIFLLHCIARNHVQIPRTEQFAHKYIFPNGNVANPEAIAKFTRGRFVIEDWHNFGPDYAKTLTAWRENFDAAWPELKFNYGEKFYRMWIFYLSFSRSLFLSRRLQLWQIVLSKDGIKPEYRSIR